MNYTFSYLYASFAFLLLLGIHYSKSKKIKTRNNQLFRTIYILGLSDIVLDIWVSYMIMYPKSETALILDISLALFYILQILFPYFFLIYTFSLQENNEKFLKKMAYSMGAITFFGILFVLGNVYFGYIYNVDAMGNYIIGPLYKIVYAYCFAYMAMAGVCSILFVKRLGKKNFITIWEFLIIITFFVLIQFNNKNLLTTGLGLSLGIFQFYLDTNNPNYVIDQLTNMLDGSQFPILYDLLKKEKHSMYIYVIDLYNLKEINKVYGNYTGDTMLQKIAKKLDYRDSSIYSFRIKGNRFLVCTNNRTSFEVGKKKLLAYLKKEKSIEEVPIDSLFIDLGNIKSFNNPEELLNYIEYLSSSISLEKGFYYLEDSESNREGYELYQSIETYVTQAVENDLFKVYYQPIYSLHSGKYESLEALTRLFHPKLGQINTEMIFEIAGKKGLHNRISVLQFRKILEFLTKNEELKNNIDHIKYNLSPSEFVDMEHMQGFITMIEEYGLSPSCFKFEITEQISMKYSKEVENVVEMLTEKGIHLVLDDFGTGYSSMYSVLSLPFEMIKMDRSLLRNIETQERIAEFYKRLVDTFHHLGYSIVAEGVETNSECELLKSYGLDYLQGYYYSRPLDEENIKEFICRRNS